MNARIHDGTRAEAITLMKWNRFPWCLHVFPITEKIQAFGRHVIKFITALQVKKRLMVLLHSLRSLSFGYSGRTEGMLTFIKKIILLSFMLLGIMFLSNLFKNTVIFLFIWNKTNKKSLSVSYSNVSSYLFFSSLTIFPLSWQPFFKIPAFSSSTKAAILTLS